MDTTLELCLLGAIILLQAFTIVERWMGRVVRRESTGGIHDRLDVLIGRRCAHCDKHLGNGALKLPPEQTCQCPALVAVRRTPHDQKVEPAREQRRRKRRRRRPRGPRTPQGEEQ